MEIAPAINGVGDTADVNATASSASTLTSDTASLGNRNSSSNMYDDEDVCRICRNPGDADNPLRYPCACSGSIKFVHQDCLLQWLNHSNARLCEVCKHPFSFSPVYAENAPTRLQEYIIGMAMKASHVLQFFLRLTFVLSVWLLTIPFITFWIWRFSFVRSYAEAQALFISHFSTTFIFTDCLHGFLLSASIVFIFLGAMSLRYYFRHQQELGGGQEDEREDNGGRDARRQNGQGDRDVVDGGGAGEMIEAHVEQMFDGLDDGDGDEDVPFNELVGMQGPILYLVENAFTVLATNMIFLGIIILLPFHLGRFLLHHLSRLQSPAPTPTLPPTLHQSLTLANITLKNTLTNLTQTTTSSSQIPSHSSDITTLAIGYTFISSLLILYLGGILVIQYAKGEPLRFYGIVSVVETVPSILRQFVAAMRHLMTMVKVAFLLVIELGVFPLLCGWWLDFCTVKMFGKSMVERVDFFSGSPLVSSLIHWVVGIVYMLQISIFVCLLCGVLRKGVLHFLQDPADPNYDPFRDLIDDPVHKYARRFLLSVTVYGSLIVMLVFLPVKLAMRMAPSVFPLDISVSDLFTEIPANMLLFQFCIPFAIEHFKLRATIESLLRHWFTAVGWALGLTNFLLPSSEDERGQENANGQLRGQDRAVFGYLGPYNSTQNLAEEEANNNYESDSERYGFVLCIVLLLVVAWMTLLIFNSAIIVGPVFLGRVLFNSVPLLPITHGIKCNDLYAFIIGSYVIWTALAGVRYSIEQIKTRRATVLLGQIWKCCSIVVKSSVLLSIWIFIIPVLIGLLFELLVIVPIRVPLDSTPVFLLYQDWALGLIFLKIWTRLVMMDHIFPLTDATWRVKFERVLDNGFSRLQGFWVLREIVVPIVIKLLTALCIPYVLARGVFPVFGYPLVVNSAVYRFAWLGCLGFSFLCFCGKRFRVWFSDLCNPIRDDRYVIGRRLDNFGEGKHETFDNLGLLMRENGGGGGGDGDLGLRCRRRLILIEDETDW